MKLPLPGNSVAFAIVAKRGNVDRPARERIAKWVRHFRQKYATNEEMADAIHVATPTITNIMNKKRLPGLDVLIRMHETYKKSADDFLDWDPPTDPPAVGPTNPSEAPRSRQPGGRQATGKS